MSLWSLERNKNKLTFKTWLSEMPIKGRRISPAAFVAIVIFFWTASNEFISICNAVWFDTGSSKMSASSVSCGRIFCVSVCSNAFVWLRTDDTRLSTFLPAVNTSSKPLCKSSLPYSPGFCFYDKKKCISIFVLFQLSKRWAIWFDSVILKFCSSIERESLKYIYI